MRALPLYRQLCMDSQNLSIQSCINYSDSVHTLPYRRHQIYNKITVLYFYLVVYEPVGLEFESLRAHQIFQRLIGIFPVSLYFFGNIIGSTQP